MHIPRNESVQHPQSRLIITTAIGHTELKQENLVGTTEAMIGYSAISVVTTSVVGSTGLAGEKGDLSCRSQCHVCKHLRR